MSVVRPFPLLLAGLLLLALPPVVPAKGVAPQANGFTPDPASVQRFGPAYRYPQAGWVVLHIEGEPYERGYQHGKLLAAEIADHVKSPARRWPRPSSVATPRRRRASRSARCSMPG
jgi:hypothetical protein